MNKKYIIYATNKETNKITILGEVYNIEDALLSTELLNELAQKHNSPNVADFKLAK